jgi:hypothetical protein
MRIRRWLILGVLGVLALAAVPAQGGVRLGIGIGVGFPCYRPYWGGYPYYYPYGPYYYPGYVYAAPPPVVVQPAPVVVGSSPPPPVVDQPVTLRPAPSAQATAAAPPPVTVRAVSGSDRQTRVESYLQALRTPDERARADAVLQLGRLKATRAVDPLAATLAGDQSPAVRETAARALGLIGSPQALTVLQHAAQADPDRDVRRSAQFAVEVIQTNQRR